jgi:hypothetical protein
MGTQGEHFKGPPRCIHNAPGYEGLQVTLSGGLLHRTCTTIALAVVVAPCAFSVIC